MIRRFGSRMKASNIVEEYRGFRLTHVLRGDNVAVFATDGEVRESFFGKEASKKAHAWVDYVNRHGAAPSSEGQWW